VRQILAGEQGISIISFRLAHLMILQWLFFFQSITANAGNAGKLHFLYCILEWFTFVFAQLLYQDSSSLFSNLKLGSKE
jgi:hypothetical protein